MSRNNTFSVDVKTTDSTSFVLQQILCQQLDLPKTLLPYFDLFVVKIKDPSRSKSSIVRKLERFESPFISLASLNKLNEDRNFLTIRKSYWDPSFDHDILSNDVAHMLLYCQALRDFHDEWLTSSSPKEVKHQLMQFEKQDRKHDFLNLVRTLRFYSYIHIENSICDFPESGTKATISIGAKELLIRPQNVDSLNDHAKEFAFKVTRIRCWRLTTCTETILSKTPASSNSSDQLNGTQRLELSFEYLLNKDNLRWINIDSDQSVLISMCLHSMVQELLTRRSGAFLGSGSASVSSSSSTYSLSSSGGSRNSSSWSFLKKESRPSGLLSNGSSQESISSSSINGSNRSSGIKYNARIRRVENDAFIGIGDDDL